MTVEQLINEALKSYGPSWGKSLDEYLSQPQREVPIVLGILFGDDPGLNGIVWKENGEDWNYVSEGLTVELSQKVSERLLRIAAERTSPWDVEGHPQQTHW